jgi:hypothetical protein
MPRIFISYRREDSEHIAGRLYDRLHAHFGRDNVFMDIDRRPELTEPTALRFAPESRD